ncbi:MAG: histidine kinase dimerization/phosphoacceptor domain -containing protein [Cyclobacteriaceae bacterium]
MSAVVRSLILLFFITFYTPAKATTIKPHVYSGAESQLINGEWMLFWGQLYQEDTSLLRSENYIIVEKPVTWNGIIFEGKELPGKGYATYATTILTDDEYDSLSIYLPGFYCAQNVYLNGKLINRTGKVGKNAETSSVNWIPQVVPVKFLKGSNELVIEISNFHHSKGGFYLDVAVGKSTYINKNLLSNWLIDIFTSGAFVMIGCFFLGMFLFWKQSVQYIIYATFATAYTVRILSSGNHLFKIYLENLPWKWAVGIEYFTLYFVFWASLELISRHMNKITSQSIRVYFLSLSITIIIFPLEIYSQILSFAIFSGLAIYVLAIYIMLKRKKQISLREFSFTFSFLIFMLLAWVLEFLIHSNEADILLLNPNLLRFFAVLILGFVVSERYSTDYDQLEKLKEEAESQATTIESQFNKLEEQQELLKSRNVEIETLLKEVHHRVKNNLQLITSLLDTGDLPNNPERIASVLEDSQSRVATMSLIHQNLYMHDNLTTISFRSYIDELINYLREIHKVEELQLEMNIVHFNFDIETMVPLGLAINELATNTFKYNTKKKNCRLSISCQSIDEGEFEFIIHDNGKNLPEPLENLVAKGYGLRLAQRLSLQLMGSLSHTYVNGNRFSIKFLDTDRRKKIL